MNKFQTDLTFGKEAEKHVLKLIQKKYIGKFLLSNVFNFKYYFVKCFVKSNFGKTSPPA